MRCGCGYVVSRAQLCPDPTPRGGESGITRGLGIYEANSGIRDTIEKFRDGPGDSGTVGAHVNLSVKLWLFRLNAF